jgi:peptide/nickel transport system substrate-binding protein
VASFGDIDYAFMPQVRANPSLEVTDKGYEFAGPLAWIEFNQRIKPMDDKRFRQAVMYALDRTFIEKNIWFGQGKVATGPFNSSTRFYDANTKQYPFNPAQAEKLLDEMGLAKDANGNRATLKLLGLPYGESWNKLSEYIRQAMRRVGVNVVLESTDAGNWAKRYSDWDFEMTIVFLYQFGDPALGVARTYLSSNIRKGAYGTNASGYVNPEVDRLFEAAVVQTDDQKRQEAYSQVQRILCEDVPQGWLLELRFPTTINRGYKDVVTSAIGVAETFELAQRVR